MQLNHDTFLQSIRKQNISLNDTTLLLAVSGGADSLTLLHLLVQLQTQLNIKLHVASLDHALRDDSAIDVTFVQEIAQKWNLPFVSKRLDVQKLAQSQQIGIEAAARQARYDFLAENARKIGTNLIATAHHADDQTETVLMHILRGSGISGLIGMQPKSALPNHQDLFLIRPLLAFHRQEIEAYCRRHGLEPRIDQSNFNTDFLRNNLRHDILPHLRQLNPQFDNVLMQLGDIVRLEQDFMQEEFDRQIKDHIHLGESLSIPRDIFRSWHPAMQRRAIIFALIHQGGEANFQHITKAIHTAIAGKQGAIAQFSGNIQLRVDYESLLIEKADTASYYDNYFQIQGEYLLNIPGETKLENWTLIASLEILPDFDAKLAIPPDAIIKLRTRQAGDRFQPAGLNGHSQKLKKWLIDHKVPQKVRDSLPIITINGMIAVILLPSSCVIAEQFSMFDKSQRNIYFKIRKQH